MSVRGANHNMGVEDRWMERPIRRLAGIPPILPPIHVSNYGGMTSHWEAGPASISHVDRAANRRAGGEPCSAGPDTRVERREVTWRLKARQKSKLVT